MVGAALSKTKLLSYHFTEVPGKGVIVNAVAGSPIHKSTVFGAGAAGMGLIVSVKLYGVPEQGCWEGLVGTTCTLID